MIKVLNYIFACTIFIGAIVLGLGIGYLITAGLTYIICYCFGWTWSWLIALGVFFCVILIRWAFKGLVSINKD